MVNPCAFRRDMKSESPKQLNLCRSVDECAASSSAMLSSCMLGYARTGYWADVLSAVPSRTLQRLNKQRPACARSQSLHHEAGSPIAFDTYALADSLRCCAVLAGRAVLA